MGINNILHQMQCDMKCLESPWVTWPLVLLWFVVSFIIEEDAQFQLQVGENNDLISLPAEFKTP